MKTLTINDIRELAPCYDPTKYLPEDWQGTILDILNIEECPPDDRLWVALHEQFIDAKTLRLFAVWCARSCNQTDELSIEAINVAERHANGKATDEELAKARCAAAASAAASAAAAATYFAAHYTAQYAAASAARYAADYAARYVADYAAYKAQIEQLKKMLNESNPNV